MPIERTTAGLRDALIDELDGLRAGTVSISRARATAQLASAILHSIGVELRHQSIAAPMQPYVQTPTARLQIGSAPEAQT